jgi:hypothetical protein
MKSILSLVVVLIASAAVTVQAVPKTVAEQVTVNPSNISISSKTNVQGVLEDIDKNLAAFIKHRPPYYAVKIDQSGWATTPAAFTNILSSYNLPTFGSIIEPCNTNRYYDSSNSISFFMKVFAASACTNNLKLFALDNGLYVYINGALSWSGTNVFSTSSSPTNIPVVFTAGTNTVQIIRHDYGGPACLELLGDLVDSSNVWFLGE